METGTAPLPQTSDSTTHFFYLLMVEKIYLAMNILGLFFIGNKRLFIVNIGQAFRSCSMYVFSSNTVNLDIGNKSVRFTVQEGNETRYMHE